MTAMDEKCTLGTNQRAACRAEKFHIVLIMNQTFNRGVFRRFFNFFLCFFENFEFMVRCVSLVNIFAIVAQLKAARHARNRRLKAENN